MFIILVFGIAGYTSAQEKANHPELEWKSFETGHFYVHFHQGTERTAILVAKIAEDIFEPVTGLYAFVPEEKYHFIIKDTDDYSNGGAFFFDNKIEIWAENLDYVMRGTKNWLRDVVTHEFTHMISIQKSIKFSRTIPYGFFQVFAYEDERRKDVVRGFPNTLVSYPVSSINIPVWFAEGVAQHQADSARFDYRDPHRDMILRDRVMHNAVLSYADMGVFGKNSHGNESAYNQGFAFVNYLTGRFGEQVLQKITDANARIATLTFDEAIFAATGINADTLYNDWVNDLRRVYTTRLEKINANQHKGTAVERKGFANLYPVWSPDGKQIAWVTNSGSDWFGQNRLVVRDRESGKTKTVSTGISGSVSWSPDGRRLAYSKHETTFPEHSSYNDIFLYDLQEEKELRLTRSMRAKNPDWDSSGNKLTFVTETNGLNQLYVATIEENIETTDWKEYSVSSETGILGGKGRMFSIRAGNLKQLLAFQDGRQIYHPRWSADDSRIVFDTAVDYGRDIGEVDPAGGNFRLLLKGPQEFRYPVFHPRKNILYYASAETGIYNIYKYDLSTKETALLTNVPGGAFMPDVNRNGEIVYACYDSIGYKIYRLAGDESVNPADAVYRKNYLATIPKKNFDDNRLPEVEIKPYRQQFTGLHILPRLLIDYGTVKPGFYLFSSDVLNKMSLVAGAAVNSDFDYDLYGRFDYNELFPSLFLEAINFSENIEDTLSIRRGNNVYERIDQNINFDLTEVQFGIGLWYPDWLHWQLSYAVSLYHAKLEWYDPFFKQIANFRYRYLDGRSIRFRLIADMLQSNRHVEISPSGGRYVTFHYNYEQNDFLTNFDTGKNIGLEVFTRYNYHKLELDWEEYFTNPLLKDHAFALRLRAGYIDRPVDDFFHLFAGGLIGMRGYSYFSIEGTKKLVGTITYRFPLWNHIDWQVFNIYFNKLYLGVFYDYGNAWTEDKLNFGKFKRDVGVQLRLETFSNYLFPTRLFAEAVYPMDEVINRNIDYKKDWRFYFGVLFDFDLRERFSPLSQLKGGVR